MKYLFGDSTEFKTDGDFLELLDKFIGVSIRGISTENSIFDIEEQIKNKILLRDSTLNEMDVLLSTIEVTIADAVSKSKEQETIVKHAEKIKESAKSYIEENKTVFSDDTAQKIESSKKDIVSMTEESRELLESFFIKDPIHIVDKKYDIRATEEGYSVLVQTYCEGGISYVFNVMTSDIPFWKNHVKVLNFVRGVEIPAKMKKPFLKKEEVPDIITIDNYFLSDVVMSKGELEVVLKKRIYTTSEKFRLKANLTGEFMVDIYYAGEDGVEKNIRSVPELDNAINNPRLHELGEKIIGHLDDLYQKRQKLKSIYMDDKDVLEDNFVFDLIQKVAEILAPTIAEVKEHSPSEEELSLKEEDEYGKRREIYLKKSEVRKRLAEIKEKGDKLLEIMAL